MHPALRLRESKSNFLRGKRVVLGVTGSIAAVEAVRIAHELIRHGADVIPVMTRAAQEFIGPLALEYATGHRPILQLTGAGEHVAFLDGRRGSAHCLLIAPATANTIAKLALGIDDTAVTSFATVALGAGLPVVVAPAMHEVMGGNPAVRQRLGDLERMGVHLVTPRLEEEKAKIAGPESIADAVIHALARGPLAGRRVLVISGATAEPVDAVRVLTNRSSGRMGVELATAAYRMGAQVHLWNAWGLVPLPDFARIERFETVETLLGLVRRNPPSEFDVILMPAALSDFGPQALRGKISSDGAPPMLRLKALPKVIREVRRRAPKAVLVAFKAEADAGRLLVRARDRLKDYGADLVVANTTQAFGASRQRALLVDARGRGRRLEGTKAAIARRVLEAAAGRLGA